MVPVEAICLRWSAYLADLPISEGSKVLDRVRIWSDESNNTHYELKDDHNVPFHHGVIPSAEWKELRSNVIETLPRSATSIPSSAVTDLLTVLSIASGLDYKSNEEVSNALLDNTPETSGTSDRR